MKKQHFQFFAKLFGAKGRSAMPQKTRQVIVISSSQPHVLQQKMNEEQLTHGETVGVNLSPVRLEREFGKMILYFCPMKTIEITETISEGDGGSIPGLAKVEGLTIPKHFKTGYYALKNVTLTSNGKIQVSATDKTTWETISTEIY